MHEITTLETDREQFLTDLSRWTREQGSVVVSKWILRVLFPMQAWTSWFPKYGFQWELLGNRDAVVVRREG